MFYTYLDSYVFALGGPKPWLVVLAFAVAAVGLLVVAPGRPLSVLRSPLAIWALFYFVGTVAWVPSLRGYDEVWQVVYDRCRSLITLCALMLIFDEPRARRAAVLAVVGCIVLASALNVGEFLSLIRFTAGPERTPGRASGFYFNANGSALAIAMGLALVVEEVERRWRVPLLLVSLAGVATTFSRSGLLCLTLILLWLFWRRALGAWAIVLGFLLGVWLIGSAVDLATSSELLTENTASRLHLAKDDSGRIELALKAWRMFLTAPWAGHGLGATVIWDEQSAQPHNIYVTLAAEQGILGLLVFPAFVAAVLGGNRTVLCFAGVLAVTGFFSHGLLDSRSTLLLSALAAAGATRAGTPVFPARTLAGHPRPET